MSLKQKLMIVIDAKNMQDVLKQNLERGFDTIVVIHCEWKIAISAN